MIQIHGPRATPATCRCGAMLRPVAILLAVASGAVGAEGPERDYAQFAERHSPAIVTIKCLLKVKMGAYGEQEAEQEISGAMIEPSGLVLCSNTALSGYTPIMKRMMGSMAGELIATPTEIKVLIGEDSEGTPAELVARDTELDLAWVRIKDPGERTFAHLDLKSAAEASLGQRLLALRRLGKYYDRAVLVRDGRVVGVTSKPRRLFVPSDELDALGLPVFNERGDVVGVTVMQLPEADGADGLAAMMGRMSDAQNLLSAAILPAESVVKATQRALESVAADRE